MYKSLNIASLVLVVLILAAAGALYDLKSLKTEPAPQHVWDRQFLMDTAESWIISESPTYVFDGINLKFESEEVQSCASCYEFVFSFSSRQAGLGNRGGQLLAQVITSHEMRIGMRGEIVVRAVTDGVYDELSNSYLIR